MKKRDLILITTLLVLLIIVFFYFNKIGKTDFSRLCNNSSYECDVLTVSKCIKDSNFVYQLDYDCTDVPIRYFDSNYNFISQCGGMPGEWPNSNWESSECKELANYSCQEIKNCK